MPGVRVRVYGCYCSWNCAKRHLLSLGNRSWFSLLAITALKLGARLPIIMSLKNKPPSQETKQSITNKVLYDKFLSQVVIQTHIRIPHTVTTTQEKELGSPVVYGDDVSISHASLLI